MSKFTDVSNLVYEVFNPLSESGLKADHAEVYRNLDDVYNTEAKGGEVHTVHSRLDGRLVAFSVDDGDKLLVFVTPDVTTYALYFLKNKILKGETRRSCLLRYSA